MHAHTLKRFDKASFTFAAGFSWCLTVFCHRTFLCLLRLIRGHSKAKSVFAALFFLVCSTFYCHGQPEGKSTATIEAIGGKIIKNEQGKVIHISLFRPDKDIETVDFGVFSHLTDLYVGGFVPIGDRSLMQFERIPSQLESLFIANGNTTDKGLATFFRKQKSFSRLILRTSIGDEALGAISRLENLESLAITRGGWGETHISVDGLGELRKLEKLHELHLVDLEISDAQVPGIQKLTNLSTLILRRTKITDASVHRLTSLTNLRSLTFTYNKITDKGLTDLAKLGWLSYLDLSGTDVSDNGLVEINKLTKLRTLVLSRTNITDKGVRQLGALGDLRRIDITSTGVTKNGEMVLQNLLRNRSAHSREKTRSCRRWEFVAWRNGRIGVPWMQTAG